MTFGEKAPRRRLPDSFGKPVREDYVNTLQSKGYNTYPIQGVTIKFPFKPYQAQIQIMSKVIEALQKQQHAVLESPTGSGRSLALLCGALGWLEKETMNSNRDLPRIYIGSQTHRQMSQLISELKHRIPYQPKITVLGSTCHNCGLEKVSRSNNKSKDCKTHNCIDHHGFKNLSTGSSIKPASSNEAWDTEDLISIGGKSGDWSYYSENDMVISAELVFCPYIYLVNPLLRKAMNIKTSGNIIILDEAHNIEAICRESGSFELSNEDLDYVGYELCQIINNGYLIVPHQTLLELIMYIKSWMYDSSHQFKTVEEDQRLCIWTIGDEISSILDNFMSITRYTLQSILCVVLGLVCQHANRMKYQQNEQVDKTYLSMASINIFEKFFLVIRYILDNTRNGADDYRMVLMERTNKSIIGNQQWDRKIGFWCMNPAVVFQGLAETAWSVILTSSNLKPLTTFEAELGTDFPIVVEANHVVRSSQVLVRNLPFSPDGRPLKGVYSNTWTTVYQEDLGRAIEDICYVVPFGVLVFVNSYQLLTKLYGRWKETGLLDRIKQKKHVMLEPRRGTPEVFTKVISSYNKFIQDAENGVGGQQDGAVCFAVYCGKMAEGLDLSNNNCRCLVATGIPFAKWNDTKVILKRSYNDSRHRQNNSLLTGDEWYTIQAFRAINQAIGRCIRHKNDWGSILLLEERFMDRRNTLYLPKWVQNVYQATSTERFSTIMEEVARFSQACQRIDSKNYNTIRQCQDGSKSATAATKVMEEQEHMNISPTSCSGLMVENEDSTVDISMESDSDQYYSAEESLLESQTSI